MVFEKNYKSFMKIGNSLFGSINPLLLKPAFVQNKKCVFEKPKTHRFITEAYIVEKVLNTHNKRMIDVFDFIQLIFHIIHLPFDRDSLSRNS